MKEFWKASSTYLSREKFKSTSPSIFTLSTIKTFSSDKLFENELNSYDSVYKVVDGYLEKVI